jgi:hypothetical protein
VKTYFKSILTVFHTTEKIHFTTMAIDTSIRNPGPQVAIIGGGIVGVILTLGLLRQNVSVRLYEQSGGFREIGAGIAFSACARRCSKFISSCHPARNESRGQMTTTFLSNKFQS